MCVCVCSDVPARECVVSVRKCFVFRRVFRMQGHPTLPALF